MTNLKENFSRLKNTIPKAIIFDWDNTLVDTWPLIYKAINDAMRFMNYPEWSLEKVKNTVHKSMRESFPEIFGDDWKMAGEVYKNSYNSINLNELKLLPDALKMLDRLREKNILLFVVSNKIGSTLRRESEMLGITDRFFSLIGSQDTSFDKPRAEPVELALFGSGLDAKKDEIWFVGDTIADVECAYNSGCKPIIFGGKDGTVSASIPKNIITDGAIPVYFNHQEL
jgi:phosphoglycolate phosphatase